MHRPTLPYLAALNVGGITGGIAFGRISEGALGRRGAATIATVVGILAVPIYVFTQSTPLLLAGALMMGFFGAGNFGVVPGYLTERFPTVARAVGAGFAYHVGAGFGSFTPTLVGAAAGSRPAAADGDGRLHRRLGHARYHSDVARSGNTRAPFHRRELISKGQHLKDVPMNGTIRVAALLATLVGPPARRAAGPTAADLRRRQPDRRGLRHRDRRARPAGAGSDARRLRDRRQRQAADR